MKHIIYFLTFIFITFSCESKKNKIIQEILPNDGKWVNGKTTYWVVNEKDSTTTKIKPNDTLKYSKYQKCIESKLIINTNLFIDKLVIIDPLTETKISERIRYSKKLNEDLKTVIGLNYDYLRDRYDSYIIDTTGTQKKREENKAKLDSMYKYAEEHDLYLCGTAATEILYEGISEYTIPRDISLDSTFLIINQWKKTNP
ncbi:hypothetical protein [Aquimarina sp. 2201CG5-10]|uniref:hypothetical protein n=1 Tax=Aquimarina callyspongiae TaxID=3098150 RepID=UPI002AB5C4E8|nr:hypothetical protein [Aquimarina sp. 2201CG5-10]MDY8134462.1 hypothetical protein [Aquimarina sp. 2201CG5-10]